LEQSSELIVVGSGVGDLDGDDYHIAGLVFKVGRSWSNLAPTRSGELIVAGSGVGDLDGDDYRIAGLVFKVGRSWSDLASSSSLAWRSRQ
jgi:ribosomal protein S12